MAPRTCRFCFDLHVKFTLGAQKLCVSRPIQTKQQLLYSQGRQWVRQRSSKLWLMESFLKSPWSVLAVALLITCALWGTGLLGVQLMSEKLPSPALRNLQQPPSLFPLLTLFFLVLGIKLGLCACYESTLWALSCSPHPTTSLFVEPFVEHEVLELCNLFSLLSFECTS